MSERPVMTREQFNALPAAEERVGANVWIWRGEGIPLTPAVIDALPHPEDPSQAFGLTGWPREGLAPMPYSKSARMLRAR